MDSTARVALEEFENAAREAMDAIEYHRARLEWELYLEEGRKAAPPQREWKYDFGDELNESSP